ncbi:MAG: prepilin-type N-terminal cleavage/methylation domain-containing protein [Clostridium sp.]|uniref:PilW family protein n=1 Tax=Clostridium sp. TaxID=1506 RepID=UPI00303BF972
MKKKKRGFTLVELVVVIAIVVIFGGMVMTLYLSQNKSMNYVQDSTVLQDQARLAFSAMESDIRVAKDRDFTITPIPGQGDSIYKCENSADDIISYVYNSTDKTLKKCKLDASNNLDSEIATVATNVENIDIVEDTSVTGDNKVYSIELKMKKGIEDLEFKSTVALRN